MTLCVATTMAAALLLPAIALAQVTPERLLDPYLVDSPWGDFPLSRLQPGARLRLTTSDGGQSKARLITLGDSVLTLRMGASPQLETLTLPQLRALHALEVRAVPRWRKRVTTISALTGVVAGAVVGATGYSGRSSKFAEQSRSGYVAARAGVGALIGMAVGHYVIGRARWRPVTIP